MSDENKPEMKIGAIEWCDLTVKDAKKVSDFYSNVVGWESGPVSMGEYDDFNMNRPDTGNTVAGVCHARGSNSNLPSQWLMYVRVENVEKSATRCKESGGNVLEGPRSMG